MRKFCVLFLFLTLIMSVSISIATTISTTKSEYTDWSGIGRFTVRSSAIWDYETGVYAQLGSWSTVSKPSDTILNKYSVIYNSTTRVNSFCVRHFFLPRVLNVLSGSVTYGPNVDIEHLSPGAH